MFGQGSIYYDPTMQVDDVTWLTGRHFVSTQTGFITFMYSSKDEPALSGVYIVQRVQMVTVENNGTPARA